MKYRCVLYLFQVSKIKDCEGKPKYSTLAKLSLCVLSLPNDNSDPERGFSINKNILAVHGVSLKEETVEALRLVKDFIIRNKEYMNIEITKDLMERCKSSATRYRAYLDANKEKERDEARKMKEKEIKDSKDQLIFERGLLVDRLKVAEECIEQGNIELAEVTKSKVISRQKSTGSHKKINNGPANNI